MVERIAHAKVNLALHVTGQRDDGYHTLDSLVVFAEYGDRIRVEEPVHAHGPVTVAVGGEFGEALTAGPENLATSAALMLQSALKAKGENPKPVGIYLEKNLPIASGIGGGSADAAAVLLALQEFWQSEVDLLPIAQSLGADVAMCLHSKPLRATGIGDEITLLESRSATCLLLVNPGIEVPTPNVFANLSEKDNSPISQTNLYQLPAFQVIQQMRNDLQEPAVACVGQISAVLEAIETTNPLIARMSGSGATCFGLYDTIQLADQARAAVLEAHADWWCVATKTTVS